MAIEAKGRIKLSSNNFDELTDEINRLHSLKVYPEDATVVRYENLIGYFHGVEISWQHV